MPLPRENLEHECFRQPPDPSIPVWRYIDLPKLIFMLLRNQLAFARLDTLPDKFEGLHGRDFEARMRAGTIKLLLAASSSSYSGPPKTPEEKATDLWQQFAMSEKRMREIAYVSSWCMGAHESEAMWRIYGAAPASVAIKLPYERLRNSLSDPGLFVGTINYFDFEGSIVSSGNALWPIISKRHEFDYENEVRIVKVDLNHLKPTARDLPKAAFIDWNPSDHVEKIVVSPYTPRWQSDTIREVILRMRPELAPRVVDSEMGLDPT